MNQPLHPARRHTTSPLGNTLRRAAVGVVALALAGCAAVTGTTQPAAGEAGTPAVSAVPSGGPRAPGVTGLIADASGGVLQVQGADGQTAVTLTRTTSVTTTQAASVNAIGVGDCVLVRSARTTAQGTATPPTTGIADPAAPLEAASVTLSTAVDGACPDEGPGGASAPGQPPAPSDGAPPSAIPGGQGGVVGASGLVTAVDGSTLTVSATRGGATSARTVTLTDATTVSRRVAGSRSDARVGLCASARGDADDTGAMTATSLELFPATDGACASSRGRQAGR